MISELSGTTSIRDSGRRKPSIGFLGLGWIGKNRFESVQQSGGGERLSVCDPFIDNIGPYCHSLSIEHFPTYEALLEHGTDGIVIATPSALHKPQVMQALKKDRAVFCQKPLACTAQDTEEILHLARTRNCLIMADFSYRYTQAVIAIKQLIDQGDLGHVFAVHCVFHNAYGPDKSWYYNPDLSGGGCVMDLGIHLIDLVQWWFPAAAVQEIHSQIFAQGTQVSGRQRCIEDYATVRLSHSNGMTSHYACSWNISAGKDAVIELDLFGTKGGASFRNLNGSFYDFSAVWNRGTHAQVISMPPDEWSGKAILDWTERLAQGNRFHQEAESYVQTARILDRIYEQP